MGKTILNLKIILFSYLFYVGCVSCDQQFFNSSPFKFNLENFNNSSFLININIRKNHYLYKDKLKVEIINKKFQINKIQYSKGVMHFDDFFGNSEIFKKNAKVVVFFNNPKKLFKLDLLIKYQGCSEDGICFLPKKIKKTIYLQKI